MSAPQPQITIVKDTSPPTPEEQLAFLEEKTGAKVSEEQRHRFMQAQLYRDGDLAKLDADGRIHMAPQGLRVKLRSIEALDASIMTLAGELGGNRIEHDSRRCIAHEVLAVGDGVNHYLTSKGWPDDTRQKRSIWQRLRAWVSGRGAKPFARPMVGDHVFVLSTVADRASKTDHTVRIWTVHVDDVSLRWDVG